MHFQVKELQKLWVFMGVYITGQCELEVLLSKIEELIWVGAGWKPRERKKHKFP